MSKVQSTKDYDRFKSMTGNRFLNPLHARKLAASISKNNLLPYQPVMISIDDYVIDGQHRIAACKLLKIPVPYIKIPKVNLDTIRQLNANMKAWSLRDFAESYAETGNQHYRSLLEFTDAAGLPLTTVAALLYGADIPVGGGKHAARIRDGEFKIRSAKMAEELMTQLREIKPFTEGALWKTREFIKAVNILYRKGAKHDQMVQKLNAWPTKLEKQGDYRKYLFLLQDVYNNRRGHEDKLSII